MDWKPSKLTREQLEERRLEAGRLLKAGQLSQAQIAQQLGVSRMAVSHWTKRYRTGGLRRLKQRVTTGRPPKLTPTQKGALKQRLRKGARAAGFASDRWTLERIAVLVEFEFGVRYHPCYLPRLLRSLGFTPQVPQPVATERAEELIRAWLLKDWPRIKKSAAARRRDSVLRRDRVLILGPTCA
jgi:transposase